MSIEAMKQALAALETCRIRSVSEWEVSDVTPKNVTAAISALRTAIQQVAVQQPATGEPVACANPDGLKSNWHAHHVIVNKAALQMVRNALRNDVERGLKVRGEMLAELDLATFQAHPAPSVPGDDFDLICNAIDKADTITMEGDYMLDSDDCIAVVRVMQVLLSVRDAMIAAK